MLILLKTIKNKTNDIPNLPFSKSLSDKEFMDLVKESIEFCQENKTSDELTQIKNKFEKEENNIIDLFTRPKIIKDIMENSILAILVNPFNIKEIDNYISFLWIKVSSFTPMINIPFNYNNTNADLNKETIKDCATSYVPLHYFHKNMKNFINNYQLKKDQLETKIKNYIDSHNFYFAPMEEDIQGFTIHTGDIFLNLKYLREYFDKNNENLKIIIREKIILIIFHELNHGLTLEIDASKKNNFLINSKIKGKNKILKFKSILKNGIKCLPINESGNFFDFLFYNKYFIEKLDLNIAEFYLNISTLKTMKNYLSQLEELLNNMDCNVKESIFKFKKSCFTNISHCLFSLNRELNA